MRVCGCVIKKLSPFMCIKCVCVCVCERVERSEGISMRCERGKGSCLWPDLAQREGVSLYCPVLSSGSLQLVFHSTHCQIPFKITANYHHITQAHRH